MQPHCALILALKSFRGVLPLLVIVNCSDDKWGPCLLKTPDLDSVYRSPCVPWPHPLLMLGEGTSAAWTLVLLSLGKAWDLLGTVGFWALITGCTVL